RAFQSACGVSDSGTPTNTALHVAFLVASALGDEAFYTLALPLCAWVLDARLSRRLAVFWSSIYYLGQVDILRLPRPPPPVIRLDHRYSAEYGLPSTHAMGSLIPLFVLACHFEGSLTALPSPAAWWCSGWSLSISLSRLYLGVHSVTDILAGYLLGALSLVLWLGVGEAVDGFIATRP
ncbi:unnamed protein product, partial [Discosporangium mesarthrocarpum]